MVGWIPIEGAMPCWASGQRHLVLSEDNASSNLAHGTFADVLKLVDRHGREPCGRRPAAGSTPAVRTSTIYLVVAQR